MQTKQQKINWDKLNSLYDSYKIKPLQYGFTQPSLKGAKPYDTPGNLNDWSKDKRKTNIPVYKKEENESEGTETD